MLISIDHGNKQIKTVNCDPFTSGLQESDVQPFAKETVEYEGKFYTLSSKRIPYRRNKTEDGRYFILTLFAIARELRTAQAYSQNVIKIQLAIGLPPAHFGAQFKTFTEYFKGRGAIKFTYQNEPYTIFIDQIACFPQAYAAAVTMFKSLRNDTKALVLDIGGFTADYLLMQNGATDLSTCGSLEKGTMVCGRKSIVPVRYGHTLLRKTDSALKETTRGWERGEPKSAGLLGRLMEKVTSPLSHAAAGPLSHHSDFLSAKKQRGFLRKKACHAYSV